MVFTQGPLSLGESFGHERRIASITFFSDGDGGTPSISVQAANTWYNLRDTYIVSFVAGGCRKNLPLYDLTMTDSDPHDHIPPGSILPSGPVEYWAAVGNLEQVQRAIDEGSDVNASDDAGYTALHAAAENNHIEIVELLLQHGADTNAAVTSGETPADLAALSGYESVVKLLSN